MFSPPPAALPPLRTRRTSTQRIPQHGLVGEDGKPYIPDEGLLAAANAAIAVGMPLLLTGEPGCGKTDFAHAIANYLDSQREEKDQQGLQRCQVRSDTRARELLYHYDALGRFGDAHHGDPDAEKKAKDPRNYVELQPLGLALIAPIRQVVLIDEIDKAPRDLPNDLLRELERRGVFEIPEIPAATATDPVKTQVPSWGAAQRPIERLMTPLEDAPGRRPIIVITSNVERQLPDAFLRRCVFYHIDFPAKDRLTQILSERHKDSAHHPARSGVRSLPGDEPYLDHVVLFQALRDQPGLHKKPSTAELLAWVDVLEAIYEPENLLARLETLRVDIDPTTGKLQTHKWSDVPALSCLIKLREDLVALG